MRAFGLTEPEAGSDAGATRTRARLEDGEWVIDGAKQFISNSGHADHVDRGRHRGDGDNPDGTAEISAIIVPSGTPGFTVEPAYDKLGWHAADTHPLTFTGCRVPEDNLLGERGQGVLDVPRRPRRRSHRDRRAVARLHPGLPRHGQVLRRGAARVRSARSAATRACRSSIADLAVMAEAAHGLTYRAAWLRDSGAPAAQVKQAAAIAKLYASESAVTATRVASQVFGGYGFMEEYPIARFYRDAKVLEIGEGTSEVQRLLIARGLGLPVR